MADVNNPTPDPNQSPGVPAKSADPNSSTDASKQDKKSDDKSKKPAQAYTSQEIKIIIGVGVYNVVVALILVVWLVQLLKLPLVFTSLANTSANTPAATAEATETPFSAENANPVPTETVTPEASPPPTSTPTPPPDGASTTTVLPAKEFPYAFLFWTIALTQEMQFAFLVAVCGALGGMVHAIRSYIFHVSRLNDPKERWYNHWIVYYLLRPFQGGILALLFYFVLRAGFMPQPTQAQANPFGFLAIGALVGLFSEQALKKLKNIAEATFEKADSNPDDGGGGEPGDNAAGDQTNNQANNNAAGNQAGDQANNQQGQK